MIELEQTTLDLSREALGVERRAKLAELNGLLGRAPDDGMTMGGAFPEAPDAAALVPPPRRP